jgi:hypothetical protein
MNPPNKPQHPPNPPNGSGLLYIFFSKSEKQNYIFTMELIGGLGGSGGFRSAVTNAFCAKAANGSLSREN